MEMDEPLDLLLFPQFGFICERRSFTALLEKQTTVLYDW
jgi:hypothetical protein